MSESWWVHSRECREQGQGNGVAPCICEGGPEVHATRSAEQVLADVAQVAFTQSEDPAEALRLIRLLLDPSSGGPVERSPRDGRLSETDDEITIELSPPTEEPS